MKPSLRAAIDSIRQGKPVMCMTQSPTGSRRGFLLLAAENATAEGVNLLAKQGRGVVCVGLTKETARRLELDPMIPGESNGQHAVCTVSIDAKEGITTGISAGDRAHTLRLLASSSSIADDFVVPGHLFPYVAHENGVLGRQEIAEAAVDIARLAGLAHVTSFCGILDTQGEVAQEDYLFELAERDDIPVFTMDELVNYRLLMDSFVERETRRQITTPHGRFTCTTFSDRLHDEEHIVLDSPGVQQNEVAPTVYVHHACVQRDVFGAKTEESVDHLDTAQAKIQRDGGLIIYIGRRTPKGIASSAVAAHILAALDITAVRLYRPRAGLAEALSEAGFTVYTTASDNGSTRSSREAVPLHG